LSKEDLTAKDFVGHILRAADRILEYTKGMSREEFFADTLKQDAVIRNIEIIGEAVNRLLEARPGSRRPVFLHPVRSDLRDAESRGHGYFAVSLATV
jgi:uncharacterized protein with HEPN domain